MNIYIVETSEIRSIATDYVIEQSYTRVEKTRDFCHVDDHDFSAFAIFIMERSAKLSKPLEERKRADGAERVTTAQNEE